MPVNEDGRFRVMTTPKGKKVRLHFKRNGEVDEAKDMESGATHTAAEFKADKAKQKRTPLRMH